MIQGRKTYAVKGPSGPIDIKVSVPGSKSMTNRALLLAALSDGECELKGCGMSDDIRVFLEALVTLGFSIRESYRDDVLNVFVHGVEGHIPEKDVKVYVGSAGTAARFLTAFMALSDGTYEVSSSDQMKKRPMRPLLEALELLGARFHFYEDEYRFPFKVYGAQAEGSTPPEKRIEIPLNIDESSQFLSALLLCEPMVKNGFDIKLTGTRQALSYVTITKKMREAFGYSEDSPSYKAISYDVEPDVSAACYFYAMAAINGGRAKVHGAKWDNTQGDLKFIRVLEKMGCTVSTENDEIVVSRDPGTKLSGIDIDMSDMSDQTMTLAAIAPFAGGKTRIRGVSHIRGQESDRITGIVTELRRLGVECTEYPDGMEIVPVDIPSEPANVTIQTYDDHRMAMAFAVLGTGWPGVIIDNPSCAAKTFESFFDVLELIF